jgi:hypothetical protein
MNKSCNYESIMVSQKTDPRKTIFWTEKKVTCDTHSFCNLHISVLVDKTKNMQSSNNY